MRGTRPRHSGRVGPGPVVVPVPIPPRQRQGPTVVVVVASPPSSSVIIIICPSPQHFISLIHFPSPPLHPASSCLQRQWWVLGHACCPGLLGLHCHHPLVPIVIVICPLVVGIGVILWFCWHGSTSSAASNGGVLVAVVVVSALLSIPVPAHLSLSSAIIVVTC